MDFILVNWLFAEGDFGKKSFAKPDDFFHERDWPMPIQPNIKNMSKKSKTETVSAPRSKKPAAAEVPAVEPAISKIKGKKTVKETEAVVEKPKASSAKTKKAVKPTKTVKGTKPAVKKVAVSKPAAGKSKSKPVEIHISNDDIALRAYFIAERRQKMGWPGSSADDWLEAESQLRAEALAAAKKKAN